MPARFHTDSSFTLEFTYILVDNKPLYQTTGISIVYSMHGPKSLQGRWLRVLLAMVVAYTFFHSVYCLDLFYSVLSPLHYACDKD